MRELLCELVASLKHNICNTPLLFKCRIAIRLEICYELETQKIEEGD